MFYYNNEKLKMKIIEYILIIEKSIIIKSLILIHFHDVLKMFQFLYFKIKLIKTNLKINLWIIL